LYGIADSPVGLAAWLLDHNDADGQPAAAVASALDRTTSATGELTRDGILDNITLLADEHRGSASGLYWEDKGGFFNAKSVSASFTSTKSTEAATSPLGNRRNSLQRSAQRSGHFGR
jgi:hypothetical protein